MTDQTRGGLGRYIESDGNRADLYFSARTSTLIGAIILVADLFASSGLLLLSGVIILAVGLALFAFFLKGYLGWRAYQRRLPQPRSGV